MSVFACLLSLCALPVSLDLLNSMSLISGPLHDFCLSKFDASTHSSLNSALFCGKSPTSDDERRLFLESGLFHLLVVSGAHLSFLERLLQKFKCEALSRPILFGFALMSGWQPPVVRSFLEAALRPQIATCDGSIRLVLNSWLWCLALHPQWVLSPSLHLSMAARLSLIPAENKELRLALLVLAALSPLMLGWGIVSPFLALISVVLAPPSLALWLCLGVTEFFYPAGFSGLNRLNDAWNRLLLETGTLAPVVPRWRSSASIWASLYLLALILILHTRQVRRRQNAEPG